MLNKNTIYNEEEVLTAIDTMESSTFLRQQFAAIEAYERDNIETMLESAGEKAKSMTDLNGIRDELIVSTNTHTICASFKDYAEKLENIPDPIKNRMAKTFMSRLAMYLIAMFAELISTGGAIANHNLLLLVIFRDMCAFYTATPTGDYFVDPMKAYTTFGNMNGLNIDATVPVNIPGDVSDAATILLTADSAHDMKKACKEVTTFILSDDYTEARKVIDVLQAQLVEETFFAALTGNELTNGGRARLKALKAFYALMDGNS